MNGVKMTKSGKFLAEIEDPMRKRWVWLGVFDTAEEASRAYLAEKSKFAAAEPSVQRSVSLSSLFQDSVPPVPRRYNTNPTRAIDGVRMSKTGKIVASIIDPLKKKHVRLGSFTTPEEASRAYLAKKARIEAKLLIVEKARLEAKQLRAKRRMDRAAAKLTPQDSLPSDSTRKRISWVVRNNSGKFTAQITNPITQKLVWIGTFDTEEAAASAYLAMEAEFASEKLRTERRISGVRMNISGKFTAEIRNPITKKRVWIGTFDTEEAAASAYLAMEAEFASEKLRTERSISGVRMNISGKFTAEIRNPITKKRVWIGTFATKAEATRAYLALEAEFEDKLRAKQGLARVISEKSSAPNSVSSIFEVESTGGAVGENKVSGEHEAGFGFFNGVQVIDQNGFLVGEFSMLDDLSIC